MVSPTKPSPINASAGSYSAVPNATSTSPRLNPPSPSLSETAGGEGYSGLSGRNLPSSSYLSPEQTETSRMLSNRDSFMPAPSIISRDSTYSSLATGGNRNSWGSNAALAGAAGAAAGEVSVRACRPRRIIGLIIQRLGWSTTQCSPWPIKPRTLICRVEQRFRRQAINIGGGRWTGSHCPCRCSWRSSRSWRRRSEREASLGSKSLQEEVQDMALGRSRCSGSHRYRSRCRFGCRVS